MIIRPSRLDRGAYRDRHDTWKRDAMDATRQATNDVVRGRRSRVVLTPKPTRARLSTGKKRRQCKGLCLLDLSPIGEKWLAGSKLAPFLKEEISTAAEWTRSGALEALEGVGRSVGRWREMELRCALSRRTIATNRRGKIALRNDNEAPDINQRTNNNNEPRQLA
jgi:hypothetical protein